MRLFHTFKIKLEYLVYVSQQNVSSLRGRLILLLEPPHPEQCLGSSDAQ